jgi:hypothetical protein
LESAEDGTLSVNSGGRINGQTLLHGTLLATTRSLEPVAERRAFDVCFHFAVFDRELGGIDITFEHLSALGTGIIDILAVILRCGWAFSLYFIVLNITGFIWLHPDLSGNFDALRFTLLDLESVPTFGIPASTYRLVIAMFLPC